MYDLSFTQTQPGTQGMWPTKSNRAKRRYLTDRFELIRPSTTIYPATDLAANKTNPKQLNLAIVRKTKLTASSPSSEVTRACSLPVSAPFS